MNNSIFRMLNFLLFSMIISMSTLFSGAPFYPNAQAITDRYPAILLDAYGVFWGGSGVGLFPGAKETMRELVLKGKIVGILSNTTQLSTKEIEKYTKHGLVQGVHFHFLITSGDIVKEVLSQESLLGFPTPKKKYYLFGGAHPRYPYHHELFQGTAFTETLEIRDADFIYLSAPHINGEDQVDPELFREGVAQVVKTALPMLCPNPDLFAHEGFPPKAVVRQGSIAKLYEEYGGKVVYSGKPFRQGFAKAMDSFAAYTIVTPGDVLMIGDTPETDIRGARDYGMKTALVIKTGITAEKIETSSFEEVVEKLPPSDIPDFFIERL